MRENLQTIMNSECTRVMASDISYSRKKQSRKFVCVIGAAERFAKIGMRENRALYTVMTILFHCDVCVCVCVCVRACVRVCVCVCV